ncbi:YhgE/Pip domain-containing protein [Paenibacillus sp. N1-5-1-14]|uniref:YhgE/Pip domain-containing protein n=1 Tax=Paenibacillus radicibacter TaxID=2972488 RepID=UPI002159AF1A|nr:YhgE/Pip domain-containing protein [Paenibacillus radicibacter]MCR8642077.1 YhgE/Pip domain-containing protein [Paenibacillus radicibacter]
MNKKKRFIAYEWASIVKNKKVLFSVIGVILIPLLYSSMFLWAFWDPYAKLNELPVAVVNLDEGATFNEKKLNVGQDLTDKLKESKDFKWEFVSGEEAHQGMIDQQYYMSIEIPKNFSENATKVLDDKPVQSEIKYIPNESLNFLSSQIGSSAMDKLKGKVGKELTRAYTESLFGQVTTLSDGLVKAADGAKKLSDGSKKVEDGIMQIDSNLLKLTEGTQPLKSGVSDLLAGANKLNGGTNQLKQGTGQLAGGLDQLAQGGKQLSTGAGQMKDGIGSLQTGLNGSVDGINKLNTGAKGLKEGLEAMAKANPQLASSPEFKQLLGAAGMVSGGVDNLLTGQQKLAAGANQLAGASNGLVAGADTLSGKLAEASVGAKTVDAGVQGLQAGSGQLKDGLAKLSGGVSALSDGSTQLKEGSSKLSEGMGTVVSGQDELSGKLAEAADKTSSIKANDSNFDMFADPVGVAVEKNGAVPNYGTGFAPYFLSLGLFVGALMLTIVYAMKQPAIAPSSSFSWFIGKFGVMLVVGALQALFADLILLGGLKLEVQNVGLFILLSLVTSWTFMAILQFLVTAFNDVGRFIAILLLIIQLTTSAGTFPIELIPDALQPLGKLVPMTYSVSGFKAVISSGQYGDFWSNMFVLIGWIVAMGGLTWMTLKVHMKKNPSLSTTANEAV